MKQNMKELKKLQGGSENFLHLQMKWRASIEILALSNADYGPGKTDWYNENNRL